MPITFQSLIAADASREQVEDWCRSRTQHYTMMDRKGGAGVMARVLGKYLIALLADDVALTPHLTLDGIWEPWVTMAIARHIKAGMRCMDVGACFGYYAVLMADLTGPGGLVQAWEPVWDAAVRVTAQVNGAQIDLKPYALGSIEQRMAIVPTKRIQGTGFYNAGGYSVMPLGGVLHGEEAQMKVPETEPWDFIKIDVEGAEVDVWQALKGVREVSPELTVCMEFTPSAHESPEAFLQSIIADGFHIGTVGHDGFPRVCALHEALTPDTGDFRMLWLTRTT